MKNVATTVGNAEWEGTKVKSAKTKTDACCVRKKPLTIIYLGVIDATHIGVHWRQKNPCLKDNHNDLNTTNQYWKL